jgi:uncharacterized RDD family membrane protein YckC
MVTLDFLVDKRIRRYDPSPENLPAPSFRQDYITRRPTLAHIPQVEQTLAGYYAGPISKAASFLVDVVLLILALSLTTTFLNAFVYLFNLTAFLNQILSQVEAINTILAIITALAGMIFVVFYGVLCWSLSGQTIGDLLFGIRVVRTNGSRVSFGRAILRIIGAYVSGFPLFLGFFWILWDRRRQGWHDKFAGTVVVYDWPAVPDELFLREQLAVTAVLPRQKRPL